MTSDFQKLLEEQQKAFRDKFHERLTEGQFNHIESFLEESAKLFYEAGKHIGYEEEAVGCFEHCEMARVEGIRIGLEKARVIASSKLLPKQSDYWGEKVRKEEIYNDGVDEVVNAIDAEIEKSTGLTPSSPEPQH